MRLAFPVLALSVCLALAAGCGSAVSSGPVGDPVTSTDIPSSQEVPDPQPEPGPEATTPEIVEDVPADVG